MKKLNMEEIEAGRYFDMARAAGAASRVQGNSVTERLRDRDWQRRFNPRRGNKFVKERGLCIIAYEDMIANLSSKGS